MAGEALPTSGAAARSGLRARRSAAKARPAGPRNST